MELDAASVVREFPVTWVSSYSASARPYTMAYDATRDCLWVGYYYDDDIGKINATSGAIMATKALGTGHRMYTLDMDGSDLWVADYNAKSFKKFDPDGATNTQTIAIPGAWTYGPRAMARDAGRFFAAEYNRTEICRLNPASGTLVDTLPTLETMYYVQNHIDAIDGKVWYSRYTTPRNRIHGMDGTSGDLLCSIDMSSWDPNGYIYDLSFVNSNLCWMLTYNVKGDSQRWAHLVDFSSAGRFSETVSGGTTAAGDTTTFTVSLDTAGLSVGWQPLTLVFTSDDPDEPAVERQVIFIIHEDTTNRPPTADAGPDRAQGIFDPTAPFILDLDGSGSTDPDGDMLLSSWSMDGQPVELPSTGLIELGRGNLHV